MKSTSFRSWNSSKNNTSVVLAVILASILLFLMNFYTIRILSGTRAYMSGESFYAKGQKDAMINLLFYIENEDEKYWEIFKKEIETPLNDKRARLALLEKDYESAEEFLVRAKNDEEDIPIMIWLFKWFNDYDFMKEPVAKWTIADSIITENYKLAKEIRKKIEGAGLDEVEKERLRSILYDKNKFLTSLENQFLGSFGETSRKIGWYILIINTVFIIAIIAGKSFFSLNIIAKLEKSKKSLLDQNKELKSTNYELDRFVYSASHDLRAPITSLQGLISLMKMEPNSESQQHYLSLMQKSLGRQDAFITKIINFSQNKRASLQPTLVNVEQVIQDIVDQLRFGKDFLAVRVEKFISTKNFKTDPTRLEIILSNLISNAFKYKDTSKEDNWIKIISSVKNESLIVTISDNGIGIDEDYKERIFDLFFRSGSSAEGSGVGLYIVKETIDKLNGNLTVESKKGEGTSFTVTIPSSNG